MIQPPRRRVASIPGHSHSIRLREFSAGVDLCGRVRVVELRELRRFLLSPDLVFSGNCVLRMYGLVYVFGVLWLWVQTRLYGSLVMCVWVCVCLSYELVYIVQSEICVHW